MCTRTKVKVWGDKAVMRSVEVRTRPAAGVTMSNDPANESPQRCPRCRGRVNGISASLPLSSVVSVSESSGLCTGRWRLRPGAYETRNEEFAGLVES